MRINPYDAQHISSTSPSCQILIEQFSTTLSAIASTHFNGVSGISKYVITTQLAHSSLHHLEFISQYGQSWISPKSELGIIRVNVTIQKWLATKDYSRLWQNIWFFTHVKETHGSAKFETCIKNCDLYKVVQTDTHDRWWLHVLQGTSVKLNLFSVNMGQNPAVVYIAVVQVIVT